MPGVHKKHGGSTEARLLNCYSCHNIAALAPQIDRTSSAAERGTMLHDHMEAIYDQGKPLELCQEELDSQDDKDALGVAYHATEALLDAYKVDDFVCEPFLEVAADEGGSADMLWSSDTHAGVMDYKFGHAKVDNVTWSKDHAPEQLFFYLDAAMQDPDYADMFEGKRLVGVIIQPEVSHKAIIYIITPEQMEQYREEHAHAIKVSRSGTTEQARPGAWCKYCAGAPYCDAKKGQVNRFLALESADNQELDEAVSLLEQIEEQVKAVKREIMHNLEAGIVVRGLKLVEKQARRHWIDSDAALAQLKRSRLSKAVYLEPNKLRSPAQIEKAIKAAGKKYEVDDLISSSSSGLTYAPTSDKRPAITPKHAVPEALDNIIG